MCVKKRRESVVSAANGIGLVGISYLVLASWWMILQPEADGHMEKKGGTTVLIVLLEKMFVCVFIAKQCAGSKEGGGPHVAGAPFVREAVAAIDLVEQALEGLHLRRLWSRFDPCSSRRSRRGCRRGVRIAAARLAVPACFPLLAGWLTGLKERKKGQWLLLERPRSITVCLLRCLRTGRRPLDGCSTVRLLVGACDIVDTLKQRVEVNVFKSFDCELLLLSCVNAFIIASTLLLLLA